MENNSLLSCCICNDEFQHPKILSCLHSFCFACLQTLWSNIKSEKDIQCPICHQKSELTKPGPNGLKTNFFLSRLVKESILRQTLCQCANIPCGLCSFEKAAEFRCFDCEKFLCNDCQKIHNGIPLLFGHGVLSLEESRKVVHCDVDKSAPARLKASFWTPWNKTFECPNHQGEKSRFFCQTCEDLICTDCMVLDHPASSHSYTSLDKVAPSKRESAKNKMAQLKMKLPVAENLLQALKMMSSELKKGTDRAKKDVKAQAQLNRERVDEEEQCLLKEIRLESQKQMRQLKEAEVEVRTMLRHIHNSLQSGSYFVEESTDNEFLWLYLILMKNLEHLEQLQIPRRPSTLSFISTEIDISLGELQKIDTAEMIIEEENTKSGKKKIDMSSPSSSSEISQPHARKHAKETDVLEKPVISDSSSVGPDSDAKNIMSSTQPSKTSTLPKPISQPTGKQTDKISSQQPTNSSGPKSSASAGPGMKVATTSLPKSNVPKPSSNPTSKQTDKISSQQPSNSSGPKSSASAGPGMKVATTSLPISNVPKPSSNPTSKQTDKISGPQQPSNSSGPKSSPSAGLEMKVDTTSLPMSNVPKPSSNPTGKQTDKISSPQQPSNSSGPKPSASAGPGMKVDTTSHPMSNVPKPSSNPTGKQTAETSSQQPSNSSGPKSSASAEPVRKVDKTSLLSEPQPIGKQTDKTSSHQSSNSSGPKSSASARPVRKVDTTSLPIKTLTQPTDKTSSQQTNNSSAPKPSSSGARVSASDRVLRSSTKLNPINEGKVEIERQALQTRTNQPHLQSSSEKATADKISSHSKALYLPNEQRDKSAFQPKDFSVKSGKNKQKSVEKKDPADPRLKGVQGGSMEESQRRDETDSAFHKENGLQKLPAHLDSTSKSNHRWFSDDDCDSDDSDL